MRGAVEYRGVVEQCSPCSGTVQSRVVEQWCAVEQCMLCVQCSAVRAVLCNGVVQWSSAMERCSGAAYAMK